MTSVGTRHSLGTHTYAHAGKMHIHIKKIKINNLKEQNPTPFLPELLVTESFTALIAD